ncbi:MAG: penicillin-binding protein 2 [Ruminococcaceae bacterium]|nr:penicillin-binding protein 2 [Oscillospiraceae bacterium]
MSPVRRNLFFVLCLMVFGMLLLVIVSIATIQSGKLATRAASQRAGEITVKEWRGGITDRNGIPLVDARSHPHVIDEDDSIIPQTGAVNHRQIPFLLPMRYDEQSVASHVVGYVNGENEGISGIEQTYDHVLATDTSYVISGIADARRERIAAFGASAQNASFTPQRSVRLTLDYHIQKAAEDALYRTGHTGAVVVLDTQTFDVRAMVSAPDFDRNHLTQYLDSDGGELLNRALCAYDAGSVFKIITSAAALGTFVCRPDDLFWCNGFRQIHGLRFGCLKEEGHGELSMRQAFALSCNCVFYELGSAVSGERIRETARAFGLGEPLLAPGTLPEHKGNIPFSEQYLDTQVANLSIGQGGVMMTPLQAANVACIIANNGYRKSINLVDGVVDAEGNFIQNPRRYSLRKVTDEIVSRQIGEMMLEVTRTGTGQGVRLEGAEAAGKTSSAETGWAVGDETMVHGWFVGYFPYHAPRYAMAVFVENGRQGARACVPVFDEIAEKILQNHW